MAKKAKGKKSSPKKTVAKKKGVKKGIAKKKAAKKSVAKGFTTAFPPAPYRCVATPDPAVCLKFMYNATTGRYDIPSGGIPVSCASCRYF
jgi:hypothetical protein